MTFLYKLNGSVRGTMAAGVLLASVTFACTGNGLETRVEPAPIASESEDRADVVAPWERARSTASGAGEAPSGMVLIPAGYYRFGSDRSDPGRYAKEERDNSPQWIDAFYVDEYEFPNRKGETPRTNLSWTEAAAACGPAKRLCTEYEWEAACEGPEGLVYGYGDAFDADACQTAHEAPTTSGAFPECRSPFNVFDMPGNVAEWTTGRWEPKPWLRVARSGAFSSKPRVLRCANRIPRADARAGEKFGLRCCASADKSAKAESLAKTVPTIKPLALETVARASRAPSVGDYRPCLVGPGEDWVGHASRVTKVKKPLWTSCGKVVMEMGKGPESAHSVPFWNGRRMYAGSDAVRRVEPLGDLGNGRRVWLAGPPPHATWAWGGKANLVLFGDRGPGAMSPAFYEDSNPTVTAKLWRFAPGLAVVVARGSTWDEDEAGDTHCRTVVLVTNGTEVGVLANIKEESEPDADGWPRCPRKGVRVEPPELHAPGGRSWRWTGTALEAVAK